MKKKIIVGLCVLALIVLSMYLLYIFRPRLIVLSYPDKSGSYRTIQLKPGATSTWRVSGKFENLVQHTSISFTGRSTDSHKDVSSGRVVKSGEAYIEHDSELVTDFDPFQGVGSGMMERSEVVYRFVAPSYMVPYQATFENAQGRNTYYVNRATRLPTRLVPHSKIHTEVEYFDLPPVSTNISIGGIRMIDVPLGQFSCLKYDSVSKASGTSHTYKGYFCPTLGIMPKYVRIDQSKYTRLTITYELIKTNIHILSSDKLKISRSKLN